MNGATPQIRTETLTCLNRWPLPSWASVARVVHKQVKTTCNHTRTSTIMYHIDIEKLRQTVKQSLSWNSVYNAIGCKGRQRIQRLCNEHQIDYSHFTGQSWNRGRVHGPTHPIEMYFNGTIKASNHDLKERLFKEGFKEECCERCRNTEWQGEPISLELHHINGDSDDSHLINLQILCPNCHALTPNYRGRRLKRPSVRRITREEWKVAIESSFSRREALVKLNIAAEGGNYKTIDKIMHEHGLTLKTMIEPEVFVPPPLEYGKRIGKRKVIRPAKEELTALVWTMPTTHIAKRFGVTDKAVAKWCQACDISKPPRGFWAKRAAIQTVVRTESHDLSAFPLATGCSSN